MISLFSDFLERSHFSSHGGGRNRNLGRVLIPSWWEMDQSSNRDQSYVFLQFQPSGNVLLCFLITKGPCISCVSSVSRLPRDTIDRNIPNLSLAGILINWQEDGAFSLVGVVFDTPIKSTCNPLSPIFILKKRK